ncbi:serine protease persephone-like [Contarinia nasturtii]|uniref:serine protease persephone-like n=1 Tax=Contarinia nasturtii TaxID=265458 RepID=UPI0012D4550D|nr:serine protease persephone-like [Contarinia nasturtii]
MKYFFVLLCFQLCLIQVLSVTLRTDGVNGRDPTNPLLRPAERACNVYSNMPESRILGGQAAAHGEFPWMAALGYIADLKITFKCGGTIISKDFVLTAAHAITLNHLPVLVRLGKLTLTDNGNDDISAVDHQVKRIYKHPNRSALTHKNDIALISLTKSIQFTANIAPACLHTSMGDLGDLIVTGWGLTDPVRMSSMSNELLKAQVKTIPLSECNSTFVEWNRKVSNFSAFQNGLDEGQYCAHDPEGKKDSCFGDGGGPLQFFPNNSKTATVVGIVSFGHGCGTSFPTIYTRVAQYLDWIEPIVWPSDQ